MVDLHYFIFVINADELVLESVIFGIALIALVLIYRMWRLNLKCPHCGASLKAYRPPLPASPVERAAEDPYGRDAHPTSIVP